MGKKIRQISFLFLIVTSALPVYAGPGPAEWHSRQLPVVALAGIKNSTGLEIIDETSALILESLRQNIEMTGLYRCAVSDTVKPAAEEMSAGVPEYEFYLSGNMTREDGDITVEVDLYSVKEGRNVVSVRDKARTPVKLRESSETILTAVMEYFTGKPVSFASVSFVNKGREEGRYSLYIDSVPIGENVEYIAYILSGNRHVEILQDRIEGKYAVADIDLLIAPDDRISIEYEIPPFLESEKKLLDMYEKTLDLYLDDRYRSLKVDSAFRKLFSLLDDTSFSSSAAEKKEEIESRYEVWKNNMTEWGLEKGLTPADMPYSFGLKALIVTSSMKTDDWDITAESPPTGSDASWGGGFFGCADIFRYAGIQGEFLVYNSRFSVDYPSGYPSVNPVSDEISVWFVEFPVIVYFRVPSYLLKAYAGVSYKYRITEMFVERTDTLTLESDDTTIAEEALRMQNGAWLGGAMFEFPLGTSLFFLDFRFSRDFESWFDSDTPENSFTGSYFNCGFGLTFKGGGR